MNDVMSLLIQLEKQAKLKISADKNENGDYIPETVYLKFTNKEVNVAIADYLKMDIIVITGLIIKLYYIELIYFDLKTQILQNQQIKTTCQ